MLTRVYGATLHGIEGVLVSIEVDSGRGLPSFHIVGQGDRVVNESRDRIRAAFRRSGLEFPPGRVTVNLVPTGVPKAGSALDLSIALGIAVSRTECAAERLNQTLFLGELGLDGKLHTLRGTLALVAAGEAAGLKEVIAPLANLEEASAPPGMRAWGAPDLGSVLRFLHEEGELVLGETNWEGWRTELHPELDLADVRGQTHAKRALEIAAAGGHNALLMGPPGSGKTLLARRLPDLLPNLSFEAALEATRIHSVAGALGRRSVLMRPPLRAPHHSISDVGMIGGGRPLRPGEISLAHRGVLFLDELPEFRRPVLEALRQPLEEGVMRLARSHGSLELPARFQLVVALNPCPCGFLGDTRHECRCDDPQLKRYRSKLSGPLLDRIDLHVAVPSVPWAEIRGESTGESSVSVCNRVLEARERQTHRYGPCGYATNSELPSQDLTQVCRLESQAEPLLARAVRSLGLSMRAYLRVLRVSRTIADLAGDDLIRAQHIAEAVGYRHLDGRASL